MTREQIGACPRRNAKELLGDDFLDVRVVNRLAIECELNYEWWRGYHAAKSENQPETK